MDSDRIDLLDHGYVRFIERWGSDARIIQSARMSTNRDFRGWDRETYFVCSVCQYTTVLDSDPAVGVAVMCPNGHGLLNLDRERSHPGDTKLLRYLYTHHHLTPFEMGGLTFEVQAPIFVFREWHRHRTQSYNELSARYTPLPDVNYIPTVERLLMTSATNKQAQGTGTPLTPQSAEDFRKALEREYTSSQQLYSLALNIGVPKELARLPVPVGRYSRMRASANLRNWLQFLTLRMDEAAQWEIRQYAYAVGHFISKEFPRTWELFAVSRL